MDRQKNVQIFIICILAVTVLVMSVGFAYYQRELTMTGTVNVTSSSWNIHFADASTISETAGSETMTHTVTEGTSLVWGTTLSEPGDFAEFSINVLNEGTFNAVLTDVTMGGLTATNKEYLKYEVYYGAATTPYEETATGLNIQLAKKATNATVVPVKVRVTYLVPADSTKLPSEDVELTLTLSLIYKQEGYDQEA